MYIYLNYLFISFGHTSIRLFPCLSTLTSANILDSGVMNLSVSPFMMHVSVFRSLCLLGSSKLLEENIRLNFTFVFHV